MIGNYVLQKEIGKGNFSVVYLGLLRDKEKNEDK